MEYRIDKSIESRIDRYRYIGKQFATNKGFSYKVLGVWDKSNSGEPKRYVVEFNDGSQNIALGSSIKDGTIKYTGKQLEPKKEIYTALLVSDIHFCYEDKDCISILYQIAEDYKYQIDELIDLGDGINNNALSRFVDIEPNKYTLLDEINAYANHMYILRNILKKSKFTILEDNHYHLRKERWIAENPSLAGLIPDIGKLFDEIVSHAVPYKPFGQGRFGLIHGTNYGKFFTKANLESYGMDIICGHTHTVQTYVSSSGRDGMPPLRSYGIPCMSIRQRYMQGVPTRQVGGFAILTYDSKTDNYNIEYVLVEGKRAIFRGKIYESKVVK